MKLDPDNTWVKLGTLIAAVVTTGLVVLLYAGITSSIADLTKSVDAVRDDVRRLVTDQVAVRQANAWLDLFRAANKGKFPELVIPDLPR